MEFKFINHRMHFPQSPKQVRLEELLVELLVKLQAELLQPFSLMQAQAPLS